VKKLWDSVLVFAKTRRTLFVGGLIVTIIIAAVTLGGHPSKLVTLTVHPGDFVQEVSVSGKVVAADDVDLGFSQAGRVANVYVGVGDHTYAGELLAEVENGDLRASLEAEQATLASLRAGAPPEEVAVAEAEVESDRAARDDAVRDADTAATNAITNIDQFISNPRGTNPQLTFSTSDSQIKSALEAGRAAIEPKLVAGHVALADVTAILANASAALARGIPGSVTQATLDGYIAAIATAKTSVNAAASALTNTNAALNTAEKNLLLKKAGATSNDIAAEEARVNEAEANLQKTMIVAPFAGTITVVGAKVGAALGINSPALSIIGSDLQIESYVPEVNIALVAVSNPASATLDAYGTSVDFPAAVASIDPAETLRDGVSTYRTILTFVTKDTRLRAGMTANVRITTDLKQGVIAVPEGVVTTRDGKKYVTIETGNTTADREVTTGELSSTGTLEVTSGLADGDMVVIPPK
jgi:multidrug efflux pump subunit AcrA (membrane-fusion protein)